MFRFGKALGSAVFIATLLMALSGCEKGPAERAGSKVDDAVEDAGKKIEKAGDNIQDAASGKKQ